MLDEEVAISYGDTRIIGTTANLREGDILSVESLLYGMMLPSGNDAAFALANHFGQLVCEMNEAEECDETVGTNIYSY
jgi:D-alanyl-D-alanine carboxypeptidase